MRKQKGRPRQYFVDDSFLNRESYQKYYYLGLMASDGVLTSSGNSIQLTQSGESGLDLINWIKTLLKAESKIYVYKPSKGQISYCLSFRSAQLWKELCFNNITPRKTFTFKIPEYILQNENKLRYFLIGYIDGDGCIGIYPTQTDYRMLNIQLITNSLMAEQLKSLDIFKNSYNHIAKKHCKDTINFSFSGLNAVFFGQWLYEDFSEEIYKSYKTQNCLSYLKDLSKSLSPKTYTIYKTKLAIKVLDGGQDLSAKQISEIFDINFGTAKNIKYKWRKKHGYIKKFTS